MRGMLESRVTVFVAKATYRGNFTVESKRVRGKCSHRISTNGWLEIGREVIFNIYWKSQLWFKIYSKRQKADLWKWNTQSFFNCESKTECSKLKKLSSRRSPRNLTHVTFYYFRIYSLYFQFSIVRRTQRLGKRDPYVGCPRKPKSKGREEKIHILHYKVGYLLPGLLKCQPEAFCLLQGMRESGSYFFALCQIVVTFPGQRCVRYSTWDYSSGAVHLMSSLLEAVCFDEDRGKTPYGWQSEG